MTRRHRPDEQSALPLPRTPGRGEVEFPRSAQDGFSLVELLVVIGIIAICIALLMPTLVRAREQAKVVQCQSNLRQVGVMLVIYANQWGGWVYPPNLGANKPPEQRWPVHVFKPPIYDPPILMCPSDVEEPAERHSYLLNNHLAEKAIKFNTKIPGRSSSDLIVMGEKVSDFPDYYMNSSGFFRANDYYTRVEPWRHGLKRGSNYLYLDMHVANVPLKQALSGVDPWDFPDPNTATVAP
jgi:prepilin-type N-terminal cleavage/methylation domain-containing protein